MGETFRLKDQPSDVIVTEHQRGGFCYLMCLVVGLYGREIERLRCDHRAHDMSSEKVTLECVWLYACTVERSRD